MLPGFLFDMDGVLVDTEGLHWEAWKMLADQNPVFHMTRKDFEKGFGKTNALILEEACPTLTLAERKALGDRKEALLRQIAKGKVTLLPGMESFLQAVVKGNHPHIIASSTPVENLKFYLKETPLSHYFNNFTSAEEVASSKPFPDVFLEAARRIHLPPQDCIVLEDAPAGMQAGRAAGSFVVALATSHPKEALSNYNILYPSPKELDLHTIISAWKQWRDTTAH